MRFSPPSLSIAAFGLSTWTADTSYLQTPPSICLPFRVPSAFFLFFVISTRIPWRLPPALLLCHSVIVLSRGMYHEGFTGAHVDNVYMNRGTQQLFTMWTPLDDVPVEMGTLTMCEGSHRLPGYVHRKCKNSRLLKLSAPGVQLQS